jgi:hydrogenase maturation factor
MVCESFGIDPVAAIAEGALLITAKPTYRRKIIHALKSAGISASVIGHVVESPDHRILHRSDGSEIPLAIPEQDPFWPVFFEALQ